MQVEAVGGGLVEGVVDSDIMDRQMILPDVLSYSRRIV